MIVLKGPITPFYHPSNPGNPSGDHARGLNSGFLLNLQEEAKSDHALQLFPNLKIGLSIDGALKNIIMANKI
jgi:hypothetical protein